MINDKGLSTLLVEGIHWKLGSPRTYARISVRMCIHIYMHVYINVHIYICNPPPPQRSTVFRVKANFERNLLGN